MAIKSILCGTVTAAALACSGTPRTPATTTTTTTVTPPTTTSTTTTTTTTPAAGESIGVATMEADGTIVLNLRATGPGMISDAQFRYPKNHKDYDAVLKHLGGLRPGESKPVPPWP